MKCAVFLEKLIRRGDVVPQAFGVQRVCSYPAYSVEPTDLYCRSTYADQCFLRSGTYTVDMTAEEGAGKNVRVYTYVDGAAAGQFPAANEDPAEMPFTFTIDSARSVIFTFGVGDWTEDFEWSDFRVHEVGGSAVDVYETRAVLPDEIVSGSISEALCTKRAVTVGISPLSEAFGFAERTITFVRVLDLDLPENRTVFRGRVSVISDIMDTSGRMVQELTCASALDFLEDTGDIAISQAGTQDLETWLNSELTYHNSFVEPFRRVSLSFTGAAIRTDIGSIVYNTKYQIISQVLTDGEHLQKRIPSGNSYRFEPNYMMEFREHYAGDVSYLDVAEEFRTDRDTAFLIGDNLTSIRVEQNADGGAYSAVCAVSGVNSDGRRATYTVYNTETAATLAGVYTLIIKADEIRCTAPMYRDVYSGGTYHTETTEAYQTMLRTLKAYAEQEAAKLSTPPIKITLTAADLAAMGFTGYERFEVGGAHPLVFPKFGYHGQRVRITALKRRLTDGKIEQITIEQGKTPGKSKSGTISALMAQLEELNRRADDNLTKQLEIMDSKIDDQSGGLKTNPLTQDEFDAIVTKDDDTIYYVDNNGNISIYKGSTHISTGGGGDEPTIETAAVLTSEQMTYWAPEHELVPVDFRGNAMVHYAQAPSRIVLQGQLALFGVAVAAVTANDIMSEVTFDYPDGARQKIKVYITAMTATGVSTAAAYYDVSGAAETLLGVTGNYAVTLPSGWQSLRVGLAVHVSEYSLNENDELIALASAVRYVFADGTRAGSGANTNIKFGTSSTYIGFGSDAERGFASGISRRTEPSYPNGGGGE